MKFARAGRRGKAHALRASGHRTRCGVNVGDLWVEAEPDDRNPCSNCKDTIDRMLGEETEDTFARFYDGAAFR